MDFILNLFYRKNWLLAILFWCITAFVSGQNISYFDTTWTNYFRLNSGGWTAGDATISIPLPDSRVIWLFGDSYTNNVDTTNNTLPCLFQVRNCYMVQDSVNRNRFKTILDTTMTGVNRTTFKIVPNDTTLLWPGHGYVDHDTVYIFTERYHSTTLAYLGCYVVKLHLPDLHQVGIYPVHDNGPNSIYGRAVIADTNTGYLYIYGNRLNWIVWEPVVARCSLSNPLLPWEYYTGSGWSWFPEQAQKISSDPVSPGFSVMKQNGNYYLITQENGYLECGLGREMYSYQSHTPWGPFTNQNLLYTEESKFNGAYLLTYNAQAHPFFTENNELLLSYNVNDRVDTLAPNICPSECRHIWTDRMDADCYRPKFVRIPMDMITGTGTELTGRINLPELRLHPDPVKEGATFTCEIVLKDSGSNEIAISDMYGRIIFRRILLLGKGRNIFILNAPMQKGIYLVSIKNGQGCSKTVRLAVD
ncbi:MAG: DUF5005 domain-containing protein [Bacteroidales bacterium]